MPARMELPVKARVLVLGRDSTLRKDMVAALPSESCEILVAADCRQALDIARTGQVDVLVVDFDTHSRELSQLASIFNFAERRCPTLVLAGSLEQLTLASETGVDGVLMKPLDPDQGRTVIHNLLAGARMQAPGERWRPWTAPGSEVTACRGDWETNHQAEESLAMKINTRGKVVEQVDNTVEHYSTSPRLVSLRPGNYTVSARDKEWLSVKVPVVIERGRTTKVHLDDNWQPPASTQKTEVVSAPDGNPAGWRADLPPKQ